MAAPLSAGVFAGGLRAEGLRVVEYPGWASHSRDHVGAWGPVHGVMLHHTGAYADERGIVAYCRDGDVRLPGPLCHGVIDRAGTVHLVGYGRANHAGGGDPRVLDRVVAEDYGDRPPAPGEHEGSAGSVDGNRHFYGFECVNRGDGVQGWPGVQVDAMVRASAAVCRLHGWGEKSVVGHLEWSDHKPDPRGLDMRVLRGRVGERLVSGGGGSVLSREDVRVILETDGILESPPDAADRDVNRFWTLRSHVQDTTRRVRAVERVVGQLAGVGLSEEQLDRLVVRVADAVVERLVERLED